MCGTVCQEMGDHVMQSKIIFGVHILVFSIIMIGKDSIKAEECRAEPTRKKVYVGILMYSVLITTGV